MRRSGVVGGIGTALAALVGAPSSHAQYPIETLTFSIEWENDVSPTNPTAKGAVWAMISPNIGTQVQWNTSPGTGQAGTLMAFGWAAFDTLNIENAVSGTLSWSVPSNWDIAIAGASDGNGGIKQSTIGQIVQPNPAPNTLQKVKLLDLTWTTDQFTLRHVEFATQATVGKVHIDVGLAAWPHESAELVNGVGGFWVVPTPSMISVGVVAAVWGATRRRRGR